MGQTRRVFLIIATSISLLLGIVSCAEEITEPQFNLSYAVVDTGQEKCYDDSREIACP